MAPFLKKQPQALAEIKLPSSKSGDTFNSSPHHFLSHETIVGDAVFTLAPGTSFDHSKIQLKGSVKTTTKNGAAGWRTENLPFLGVLLQSQAQDGFRSDNGVVRIPFRFNLNECEKLAAFISSLPPSIDSKQEGQRPSDPQYEITYSISATAFSARGSLASAVRRVYIDPVSPDLLSDSSSETAGEYFWATKETSQSGSESAESRDRTIELAVQEPPPIILDADSVESDGSTEVPCIVKFLPRKGEKLNKEAFPTRCHIRSQLATKTSMTPDGMKALSLMMVSDNIKVEGKTTTKIQYSYKQDHTVPISQWEEALSDSVDDSFSVARFSCVFRIDRGKPPLASFQTPLLSRHYLIDLVLSFDGSDDTFKLSLPCEIVHGSVDATELYDESERRKSAVSASLVRSPTETNRRSTLP